MERVAQLMDQLESRQELLKKVLDVGVISERTLLMLINDQVGEQKQLVKMIHQAKRHNAMMWKDMKYHLKLKLAEIEQFKH